MTVQGLSLKCLRVSRKLEPAGMEMRLLEKGVKCGEKFLWQTYR